MRITSQTWTIPAKHVMSLVWSGESLIDWAAGGVRYDICGSVTPARVSYAYRFDAACSSPTGDYAVLYKRLGTKGIVLHRGKILREINRSCYYAEVYEYPVVLCRLGSGREVLVHCPDEYNRLEIDDVASGKRLTPCKGRNPSDVFHSRLVVDAELLLSAGWVWHPLDVIGVYRIEEALKDATVLDGRGQCSQHGVGISAAAFLGDNHILVATSDESFLDEADLLNPNVLHPNSLAVCDTNDGRIVSQVSVAEPVGTMMKLAQTAVVSFFDHPKVFDLGSGSVVWRMRELKTGTQASSIIDYLGPQPPLALDSREGRFAVATEDAIHVVRLHCSTV